MLDLMRRVLRRGRAYYRFAADYRTFQRLSEKAGARFPLRWSDRRPCLYDRTATTPFDRHYVYHTAWAARVVRQLGPPRHVDIGSSLYFVAIASAFVPTDFYDYRPAELGLDGLASRLADLTNLAFADRSVPSLSCMHVVEHVGLGRYGDPLDPAGDVKAMRELERVVAPGGSLLFVVPVGRPRICYNAHRIYGFEQIVEEFAALRLRQFALIPDEPSAGGLILNADPTLVARQRCACGCFWLQRLA
jgi:SAM-dependent methyltransferase